MAILAPASRFAMLKWRYWLFGPTLPFVLLVATVSLATWQAPWEPKGYEKIRECSTMGSWTVIFHDFTISCFSSFHFWHLLHSIIPLTEATWLPSTWVRCKVNQEHASNASAEPNFVNCSRPIPARKQTPQLGPLTGAPLRRTNSWSFRIRSNRSPG